MAADELARDTEQLLQTLMTYTVPELQRSSSNETSAKIVSCIETDLASINANIDRLGTLANKERDQTRKTLLIERLKGLRYDVNHCRAGVETIRKQKKKKEDEEVRRQELLTMKVEPNERRDTVLELNQAERQQQALHEVDYMIGHGKATLTNLREQHSILKNAQKRVLDLMNTLGLSNTVLRLIEKRTTQDKIMFWGGVLLTIFIMFLVVKYFT